MKKFVLVFIGLFCSLNLLASFNYTDPQGPIYANDFRKSNESFVEKNELNIVSLNLEFSKNISGAIKLFKEHPIYSRADVILLQEVVGLPNDPSVNAAEFIARELNMKYVYSPAVIHKKNQLDFGVGILSKFDLYESKKIILPHLHVIDKSQRVSIGASIFVNGKEMRFYSLHAETLITGRQRNNQAKRVREDAVDFENVLIGGDFNDMFFHNKKLFNGFKNDGYNHPTRKIGFTFRKLGGLFKESFDHFFSKGMQVVKIYKDKNVKISDHLPILITIKI